MQNNHSKMPASAAPAYKYPKRKDPLAELSRSSQQQSPWEREHTEAAEIDGPSVLAVVDTVRHRYPFAVVWTPIHPITWMLPFVGHMGICDSRGIVLDFTGDIGVDDLAFGSPKRYLSLNPSKMTKKRLLHDESSPNKISASRRNTSDSDEGSDGENGKNRDDDDDDAAVWDAAVLKASRMFEHRMHLMICGNDCHSHVAVALNEMAYGGCTWWNKVILAAWMFFCGRHTSWSAVVHSWLGFALFIALVVWTRK